MRRFQRALLAAAACLLLCASASADAYDAAFARAIAAKERALDTNEPAAWEDALERFETADRLRQTKEGKYELAGAAARLRQDDLAVEAYEAALALGLDGAAADKARAFVAARDSELGRLSVTGPEGAEIFVRGRRRAVLPASRPLRLFAGDTRVRAVHAGKEAERAVNLTPGQEQQLDVSTWFVAQSTPKPNPPQTPSPDALPPDSPPPPPPPEPSSTGPVLLAVGGGVALAGVVTVIAAGGTVGTHRDRLAELCAVRDGSDACPQAKPGQRDAAQSEVDAIATWKGVRVAGWVGVGLGAATAVTGAVLWLSDPAPRQARLGVLAGPSDVRLIGRF